MPGHGCMQELMDSEDLIKMYKISGKRKEIMLWCCKPMAGAPKRVSVMNDQQAGPSKKAKNIAEMLSKAVFITCVSDLEHIASCFWR